MIKNATVAPNVRQQPQEEPCRSVVCVDTGSSVCACVCGVAATTITAVVVLMLWCVGPWRLDPGPVVYRPQIQHPACWSVCVASRSLLVCCRH